MQLYTKLMPINAKNGTAVALGYFDGVHLGHRAVIGAAVQYARRNGCDSAVFTFSMPSNTEIKGKGILSEELKQERIAALCVEHYMSPSFSEFCKLTPLEFVSEILVEKFAARAVFCGDNFTFGAHKAGDVALLTKLCKEYGIQVYAEHLAQYNDIIVSSTRIRTLLIRGDVDKANAMLGAPYAINYEVVHGKGLGAKLGVPTINQVFAQHMLMPKCGVYATRVYINGKIYSAATGLGSRPTVQGEGITCESFIKGFDGDIYGEKIKVEFIKYLHDTKRYETLNELRDMINEAAEKSEALFIKTK
ncbi:MAG: riboflavin biosynthesis protein RibF [Oscillospiraceae bacterium]